MSDKIMKRLLYLILTAMVIGIILSVIWISQIARIKVDIAASKCDPATASLPADTGFNVRSKTAPGGIQFGLVELKNGQHVKFWFLSHHHSPLGCTRFDFADGESVYMKGAFCCEVQIPDDAIINESSLLKFIHTNDGIDP